MIKNAKYLIFVIILTIFSSCSFDKKSGIWSEGVEEKRRIAELEKEQKSEIEVVNIYSQKRIFSEEIPATKNISLTQPKTNLSWEMSILNLQNLEILKIVKAS